MEQKLPEKCSRYNSYIINNQTFLKISSAYEGIPQNFAINVGSYFVLIGLFIFLRKKAWNYGKLSWLNKPKSLMSSSLPIDSQHLDEGDSSRVSEQKSLSGNKSKTLGQKILNYVPLFIKMSDLQLGKRCGTDAVIYCQFQRSLMITVFIMMFLSLVIIIPLNLKGGSLGNSAQFGTLTIGNITEKNPLLWGHFVVTLSLMLLAFYISNRFLQKIDIKTKDELNSTIMIRNVPVDWCDELSIQKHFTEAFPSIKVRRVQVTYKVDKLINIHSQKLFAEEALISCYNELENGGDRIMVVPQVCGRVLICRCCELERCKPVDGVTYYSSETVRLTNLLLEEKFKIMDNDKLPIVFVTFESVQQALLVRKDYVFQNYLCFNEAPTHMSTLSADLKSSQWKVVFAPVSTDILWQNLHKHGWKRWITLLLANFVVALVVIILSTPSTVLNLIAAYNITKPLEKITSPIVSQFVPSLILVIVSSLMPVLVCWSDQLSGHWTNTMRTMAIMNKLYAILVTTVLILPSLGLNSIPELLKWVFPSENQTNALEDKFRWGCIFMPDGGALFCNYLIAASFIGTALELLRFGDLFMFAYKTCCSKSRAEDRAIAQNLLWEFQFGLGYAWTLALFSMISAYSVIVPIITPFGLVYLILKHMVDRYNLVHVNIVSEIHNSVHANAAQLMQIGLILMQATVTVYVTLKNGPDHGLSICCYLAFVLGIVLAFGRTVRRWIINLACYKYSHHQAGDVPETMIDVAAKDLDDEEFIFVDRPVDNHFIPLQLVVDEPPNIEDIIRRRSRVSQSGVKDQERRQYGST